MKCICLSFAWLVTKWIRCVLLLFLFLFAPLIFSSLFLLIYTSLYIFCLSFCWILHNKLMAPHITKVLWGGQQQVIIATKYTWKMHVKHLNSLAMNVCVWVHITWIRGMPLPLSTWGAVLPLLVVFIEFSISRIRSIAGRFCFCFFCLSIFLFHSSYFCAFFCLCRGFSS